MSQHTPGPWYWSSKTYHDPPQLYVSRAVCSTPHGVIAEIISETDELSPVDIANARLIAAAPELLASAIKASSYIASIVNKPGGSAVLSMLETAIAKAEGRA